MERKSVKITIGGKSYVISTDQDSSKLIEAATFVDERLDNAQKKMTQGNQAQAALFVCLQLATELIEERTRISQVQERLDHCSERLNQVAGV